MSRDGMSRGGDGDTGEYELSLYRILSAPGGKSRWGGPSLGGGPCDGGGGEGEGL